MSATDSPFGRWRLRTAHHPIVRHPYWSCFSRAVATAICQSVAILVLVERAIIAIFFVEWLSGWRQSRNTQMRVETELKFFNLVWGFGKAVGMLIGIGLTHVFLSASNTAWRVPPWWEWPTVRWIVRIFHAIF